MEENLRKGLESIAKSLNRPIRPQKYMTAAEAELAYVPPEKSIEMIPVEDVKLTPERCGGHRHVWVPNSDALGLMRGMGSIQLLSGSSTRAQRCGGTRSTATLTLSTLLRS